MREDLIALGTFGCTFVAAMAGIALRTLLPAHHLDTDSRDAIKLVMGLLATITALVLGLLISSAHASFDTEAGELRQLSVNLFEIDHILGRFGPDTLPLRATLRHVVATDVERIWSHDGSGVVSHTTPALAQEASTLFDGVAGLTPRNPAQQFGQGRALQLLAGVAETRRMLAEQARSGLSWPLVAVLITWLTLLFFGFGLFARYNMTVTVTFLIGSVSVACALFLILEMSQPFRGWMQLSNAPLREALPALTP